MTRSAMVDVACLIPLFAPILGGCIANVPVDLALVSVQAADWRDQNEMKWAGGEKPHQLILKVEFTSKMNLAKFVIVNGYNLGNEAFFCDRPKEAVSLSWSAIYWRGVRLGSFVPDTVQRLGGSPGGLITYYMFAGVAREETQPSNPPLSSFDLLQKPEDICFYLSGGNELGFGYKSNIVVVPKSAIEAALRELPPGFGS